MQVWWLIVVKALLLEKYRVFLIIYLNNSLTDHLELHDYFQKNYSQQLGVSFCIPTTKFQSQEWTLKRGATVHRCCCGHAL
jgi:hypothetical protein